MENAHSVPTDVENYVEKNGDFYVGKDKLLVCVSSAHTNHFLSSDVEIAILFNVVFQHSGHNSLLPFYLLNQQNVKKLFNLKKEVCFYYLNFW